MSGIWTIWWAWIVLGFALGVLEIIVPGYIFLGFAAGAVVTGVLIGIGVLGSAGISVILMVFALLSLVAWLVMRKYFKLPGQVKIWDRDINDNP